MKKYNVALIISVALLCSCNLYKQYEQTEVTASGLVRDTANADNNLALNDVDSTTLGNLPWKELFTDSNLQVLIECGLSNNIDLKVALSRIEQTEAALSAAKWAYSPTLNFVPSGTLASFDGNKSKLYELPLTASWQVPIFGGLLNAKRKAKVDLEQSQYQLQAVKTQLIAVIATQYYTLLLLDKQEEISKTTIKNWEQSIETLRDMKKIGLANEASISQFEATYYSMKTSLIDLQQSIREVENALSILLAQPPHAILRSKWHNMELPEQISNGIPLHFISNRPDVNIAEKSLAAAYYNTNIAKSSFYPNLTLSGILGWTNNMGGIEMNPAKLLASATGALMVPIFNQGRNRANLKIAKTQQEIASLSFNQTVLNVGNEVCNALFKIHSAKQKQTQRTLQVTALESAVQHTNELFRLGTSTYLEVLTAQQNLLSAQLSEANDDFESIQAVISLYQALGGGQQ